ncbi:MAG: tetratricopeptide repeat protein [Planctomycetota bacterium]
MRRIRLWLALVALGGVPLMDLARSSSLLSSSLLANQEKGDAKKDDAKKKDAEEEKFQVPPPPADNLAIPEDLPERERDLLREVTQEFEGLRQVHSPRDIKKLVRSLKKANRIAKSSPLPDYYLGIGYQWQRDYDLAFKALTMSLEKSPTFYEAWVELGDVHVWQNNLTEAVVCYDKALELYPYYDYGLSRKSQVLIQLGRFEEAQPVLELAIQVKGTPTLTYMQMTLEKVRAGPDWKTTFVCESDNYIVKSGISQEFADEIGKRAELIRRLYDLYFSKMAKPDRKFVIIVFKDKEEYQAAGSPPGSAGYYNPWFRQLYLYKHKNSADTFLVMNHEALHQYLHDYLERAPQWLNEGLGDFFGPSEYIAKGRKEYMRIRPNWWRLDGLKNAVRRNRLSSASELMQMSQKEMYNPRTKGLNYAQAWGLVYYCLEGGREKYKTTLQKYYKLLSKGKTSHEAYRRTFARIDMGRFEKDWRNFISKIEFRKPSN